MRNERHELTLYEITHNIKSTDEKPESEQVIEPRTKELKFGWGLKSKGGDRGSKTKTGMSHASIFGWTRQAELRSPPQSLFTSPRSTRNMAEHKKQERDYTSEVDAILPELTTLAQVSWTLDLAYHSS